MTTTDRICAFLQSKLPHSFWTFHGESIRAFVRQELCKALEAVLDLSMPTSEADPKLIADLKSIASGRFKEQSKVSPAAMQEVIGGDGAEVPQGPTPERLACCDICSRGIVDFAHENREPTWHTIEDAGCELMVCQDCWEIEQKPGEKQ